MADPGALFENDTSTAEAYARSRSVYIDTTHEYGGGVVVVGGLVITTLHFVKGEAKISVDGSPATLINSNRRQDLAALAVKRLNVPWVNMHFRPRVDDSVVYFAPLRRKSRVRLVPLKGKLTHVEDKALCADMLTEKGTCGAGLWSNGWLLGLVSSDEDLGFALIIPCNVLKRFVSESYSTLRQIKTKESAPIQGPLPLYDGQGRLW